MEQQQPLTVAALLKVRQLQLQILANSFAKTDQIKYRVTITVKEEEQDDTDAFY